MVSHGGGASSGETSSETSGGVKQALKKGPWTAAEDAILIEYVKKHGEGNWNAVQRNSGLSRCGKSCRLRWANHLRPNLKKGAFSSDEERLIIELHAKLGNKWARMAAQLPGRTDNEIKNYWNTRTKRRQRAGLPLYPQEIQRDAAAFHLHHHHQRQQRHHQQQNPHSSSSSSLPSFLSPSRNQNPTYNPSLSLFDPIKFHQNSSFISNTHHQFKLFNDTHNGNFTLPYPSSSSSSPFNQTLANTTTTQLLPIQSLQFNSASCNIEFNPSTIMGAATTSFEPTGFIPLFKPTVELPSSQRPPLQSTPTNSSAATSGGDYVIAASSSANDYAVAPPMLRGNSGLLDDLLKEAQDLSRNEKSRGEQQLLAQSQWEDSSSAQSSIGMKTKKEPMEEMNSMDDELTSLLETFPSTMPVPEWYRQSGSGGGGSSGSGSGDVSNGQSSSSLIGRNGVLDINGQEASPSPAAATSSGMDHGLMLDSCCWNNMPSIC